VGKAAARDRQKVVTGGLSISSGQFPVACCVMAIPSLKVRHSRMLLAGIQANSGCTPDKIIRW